jgi:hypothetical protein
MQIGKMIKWHKKGIFLFKQTFVDNKLRQSSDNALFTQQNGDRHSKKKMVITINT